MRRSLAARVSLIAVVAMLGSVFALAPAGADTPNGNCQSGEVCMHRNADFGADFTWDKQAMDLQYNNSVYYNTTRSVNDDVSSIKNLKTGCGVTFWKDANRGGASYKVHKFGSPLGWYVEDLAGSGFNDELSSHDPCWP